MPRLCPRVLCAEAALWHVLELELELDLGQELELCLPWRDRPHRLVLQRPLRQRVLLYLRATLALLEVLLEALLRWRQTRRRRCAHARLLKRCRTSWLTWLCSTLRFGARLRRLRAVWKRLRRTCGTLVLW